MFADTVFAFPSKDVTLDALFRGFIPCLSDGGDRIEENGTFKNINSFNTGLFAKKNMHIVEVSEIGFTSV